MDVKQTSHERINRRTVQVRGVEFYRDGTACIVPVDKTMSVIKVSAKYVEKYDPQPGKVCPVESVT